MNVSQHRRKDAPIARQRWSTLAITALGLLLAQPVASYAAGFGQLRVQSNLGQPLQAEIDISGVSTDEAGNLAIKLAPPDAYAKAGLNYLPAVAGVRVQLDRRANGSYVAKVVSNQPISEPFVDILVDMSWASGKVTRAYTFLLDPVGSSEPRATFSPTVIQAATPDAAPVRAPAPVAAAPAPAPVAVAPAPAKPPVAARPARPAAAAAAPGAAYTVQRGDNLYGIAGDMLQNQEGVSLDQMLVALYRANPDAFVGGSMNRLRAGAVLKVPPQQEIQATAPRAARREVVAHTQGFDAYRSRLATAAATKPVEAGTGREQSGSVTARVKEPAAPAADSRDELKLSKPESGARKSATADTEARIARERQLKEAEARMGQLEKNVSDMQRLVELKNAEIARMAQAGKPGTPAAAPAAKGTNATAPSAPQVVDATSKTDTTAATAPQASVTPATPPVTAPVAAVTAPAVPATSQAAASASAVADAKAPAVSALGADGKPAAAAPVKRTPVAQPAPVAKPSFFDDLLSNGTTLFGGVLLIALLGGYAVYKRRQQKPAAGAQFENSILSQESTVMAGANSLLGTAGGQSVDTSQHSIFGAADFHIGNNADANEVDPIAEAEVYIAYGRDVQAEEILREALQQDPQRQAIRLKLLEIYKTRQDLEGFRVIAEEMFAQTGGQGAEWMEAAAMGRELDPGNALFLEIAPDRLGEPTTGTLPADEWRTHDPSLNPASPPSGKHAQAMGEFALPLDAFPSPAPGAPMTAPESASLMFGNTAMPMHDDGAIRLDGSPGTEFPRTPALDEPTLGRPLDFDMTGISLDLGAPSAHESAQALAHDHALDPAHGPAHEPTFEPAFEPRVDADITQLRTAEDQALAESAMPLPVPTMLRDGMLAEPIDLSGIPTEQHLDTTQVSPSTLSGAPIDSARDMQIKFDLARAYIEIGDKEGARELLQEVVDQSPEPLQAEARSLLREVA